MQLSALLSPVLSILQLVGILWTIIFGSKSVYDFWKNRKGKPISTKFFLLVSVVSVILALIVATESYFLLSLSSSSSSYPPSGWKLVFNDHMDSNISQNWTIYSPTDHSGTCTFVNSVYQITASKQNWFNACASDDAPLTDLAFEADMIIVKGNAGGITFHYNGDTDNGYYFFISPDGRFEFDKYVGNQPLSPLRRGTDPAINTNVNRFNTIAVVVEGNRFHLYVNKQELNGSPVNDPDNTFPTGRVGLVANELDTQTDVIFSNVRLWHPAST